MGTAYDALRVAASQIGVREVPDGSNITPYSKWYGVNGAWCDMFMSWTLYHAGTPQGSGKGFAWVSAHRDWLASQGRVFGGTSNVRPGDLLFFEWGSTPGGYDHIGMCERVDGDYLITIEGNVGNMVQRLRRSRWSGGIREIGRPAYASAPAPTVHPVIRRGSIGPAVGELQAKLNRVSGANLAVDGVFGPATETAVRGFQKFFGMAVDGIVGPQTWGFLDYLYAIATG